MKDGNFEPGDVVRVVGSIYPAMTVEAVKDVRDGQGISCVWFDSRNRMCRETFWAATLTLLNGKTDGTL